MRAPETRGERIRRYRKDAGLSLEECAKRAHISKGLLSQWELDIVQNPGSQKVNNLAKVLGKTPEAILNGESAATEHPTQAQVAETRFTELFRRVPETVKPHLIRIVEALAKH